MTRQNEISKALCEAFCTDVVVTTVPAGFAVSVPFEDSHGDRIGLYVIDGPDGLVLEDSGIYLADLVGFGIAIDHGTRSELLEGILAKGSAYWDRDTYEIRSEPFEPAELKDRLIKFISALIRVRDIEFLTRENIKSTFKEDVYLALVDQVGNYGTVERNTAPSKKYSEFPADIVVSPNTADAKTGAVYCVSSADKLNEALLLKLELENTNDESVVVFALLEDSEMRALSRKKFQRAQNRSLIMPIFKGDEDAAISKITKDIKLFKQPSPATP